MLNLIGSIIYLATATLCLRALLAARRARDSRGEWVFWLGAAMFFCGLAMMRTFGLEDLFRGSMRSLLMRDGAYAMRRDFQSGLAAVVVLLVPAVCFFAWIVRTRARNGRSFKTVRWAALGIAAMIGVLALRLISFHGTDLLLFGPLHLNWFMDIGATALTGWAAIRYAQTAKSTDGARPRKVQRM